LGFPCFKEGKGSVKGGTRSGIRAHVAFCLEQISRKKKKKGEHCGAWPTLRKGKRTLDNKKDHGRKNYVVALFRSKRGGEKTAGLELEKLILIPKGRKRGTSPQNRFGPWPKIFLRARQLVLRKKGVGT